MRRAATDETVNASNESPSAVRSSIGLYTKSGTFPEPREHAQLTVRLRAMELLADRLIASRIAVTDSPVVGATGPGDDRARSTALISSVEWVGGGDGDGGLRSINTAVSGQTPARALGLRLTLSGPLSALLAATAGLERNSETDRPLIAVKSATLSRRESAAAGDRYDVADDASRLVLNIEIIEFVDPATPAAPATGAH
jgi:hypothetical protein